MTRHLFLTGAKGVGKSTLMRQLLAEETEPVGGFFTQKENGAIYLRRPSQPLSQEQFLFYCGQGGDPARFDTLGCAALAQTAGCGLLVMDELGPHEAAAAAFQAAVFRTLDGELPVLGVLQQTHSDFLQRVAAHPEVTVLTVTAENRDTLAAQLFAWRQSVK